MMRTGQRRQRMPTDHALRAARALAWGAALCRRWHIPRFPPRAVDSSHSCNILSCMRRDSRLSGVLHILLHIAQKGDPVTSEVLAKAMDTNAVVVRRIMAGLRDAGYVRSEKGHGGGWTLACAPSKVTLLDIYTALGCPSLLAIGNRTEAPGCLVEAAVNAALDRSFQAAEELLLARLGEVTLAMMSADVSARLVARGRSHHPKKRHHHA